MSAFFTISGCHMCVSFYWSSRRIGCVPGNEGGVCPENFSPTNRIRKVGERIRLRLHAGREVDGFVRAILKMPSGTKLRLEYGSVR
jgi:hypothetical protein